MTDIKSILRDADPFLNEPRALDDAHARIRQRVLAATSASAPPASPSSRARFAIVVFVIAITVGLATAGAQYWMAGSVTVHAAVRFEARLAELQPAPGLREAQVTGSGETVYLHQAVLVANADIARATAVARPATAVFDVILEFTAPAAERMRRATEQHLGKPIAILIDGVVVLAPIVRSPISTTAVISGDYDESEARRIADGIGVP